MYLWPKALDLFCGGGGVAAGLQQVGFNVTGVDTNKLCGKYYPGKFVCGDALQLASLGILIDDYDFIWASPPCQRFSRATQNTPGARDKHPDLIAPIREMLSSHPLTCIENVVGAPIRADLTLTGPMVGLERIARKRLFELSWGVYQPPILGTKRADWQAGKMCSITTSLSCPSHYYARQRAGLKGKIPVKEAAEVMGITHRMPGHMIGEAVPPPMAAYIGREAFKEILLESHHAQRVHADRGDADRRS